VHCTNKIENDANERKKKIKTYIIDIYIMADDHNIVMRYFYYTHKYVR
jgi:hypothetical protein